MYVYLHIHMYIYIYVYTDMYRFVYLYIYIFIYLYVYWHGDSDRDLRYIPEFNLGLILLEDQRMTRTLRPNVETVRACGEFAIFISPQPS